MKSSKHAIVVAGYRVATVLLIFCVAVSAGLQPSVVQAVSFDLVQIGDPGNENDIDGGIGAVANTFWIATTEITNRQYAEFLNAVAATDTNSLFYTGADPVVMEITRSGVSGGFTYAANAGRENKALTRATFWNSARFANWMHNGQPAGAQDASTTEDGAYTLNGFNANGGGGITRNVGAQYWIPSRDEWHKAGYYDPNKTGGAGYWNYATGSDTFPTAEAPPGADLANGSANYAGGIGDFTDVGAYTAKPSASPYGTFDQAGNVWEWTDSVQGAQNRYNYGGSWASPTNFLHANFQNWGPPDGAFTDQSFRVASAVPGRTISFDFTWNSSESGDWVDAINWQPAGYPGETTLETTPDRHSALFGDAIGSTGQTVFANTSVSVNAIHFENSSASYAIAGLGSVNLLANTRPVNPNPAINVAANNSHQFQATVSIHANGTVDIGSGSTLEFNNRLFLNNNVLTKTGEGTLAISNNVVTSGGTINCAQGTCSGTGTIGGDLINGGGTISPGYSLGSISVVPEPSCVLLFSLGGAALLSRRRRQR